MAHPFGVVLTRAAQSDLARHHKWLKQTAGPDAADAFLDTLLDAISKLETFPERGPVPPELEALGMNAAIRQLSVPPYRVIYRIDPAKSVSVLLIADSRRSFMSLLEARLLSG